MKCFLNGQRSIANALLQLALGSLFLAQGVPESSGLNWQTGQGYRWSELAVPQIGKTGFTFLQAETTGLSYLGLPILNVADVLPEHWELPPIWNHYAKGFGAYSGFGQELRANDYASAPYEEKRAYDLDNSQVLSSFTLSTSAIAPPPVVLQVTRASTGVAISWNAVSGIRYDLISSSNVAGPYLFTTNIFSVVSGQISLTLPSTNQTQFYRLHY